MNSSSTSQAGFTLIEVIVSVVIAAIVFVGLFSSLASIFSITEGSSQRTVANNLAYANMRLYADGTLPTWFSCNTSNQTETITLMDKSEAVSGLPGDVVQTVTASAVYGCDGSSQAFPIRIESNVSVINGIEVSHATYAGY